MRNVLIFPDGSRQEFMYPSNRDIELGEALQLQLSDESIQVLKVVSIDRQEKEIHYQLGF